VLIILLAHGGAWFPAFSHGPRPARRTHNDIDQRVGSSCKEPTHGKIGGVSGHAGSHREVGIRWTPGDQRLAKRANAVKDPIGGVKTNISLRPLHVSVLDLLSCALRKKVLFQWSRVLFVLSASARAVIVGARFFSRIVAPYVIRRLPFPP
jgi:hypothetical protein